VKALKMLIHEIQSDGEAAAINAYGGNQNVADVDSDDGVRHLLVILHDNVD
jgi:hypothetical protein